MASKTHSEAVAAAAAPALRLIYVAVAAAVFLADRVTKIVIESALPLYDSRTVIPGFFNIVHVQNQGIAFGMFSDSPSAFKTFLLIAVSAAALAGVGYLLWTSKPSAARQSIALSLILGGAMGNLFDRVRSGAVVDFLDFYAGSFHWPAFNLADSAIVIGGGLMLLQIGRTAR